MVCWPPGSEAGCTWREVRGLQAELRESRSERQRLKGKRESSLILGVPLLRDTAPFGAGPNRVTMDPGNLAMGPAANPPKVEQVPLNLHNVPFWVLFQDYLDFLSGTSKDASCEGEVQ